MVKIALVDDHKIFLESLSVYLNSIEDFEIVNKSSSAKLLLEFLATTEPADVDIVLVDLKMDSISGLDCLEILQKDYPHIKTIVLTMFNEALFIQEAYKRGAVSFLTKETSTDILNKAIRSVYENGFYANEDLSNLLIDKISSKQSSSLILTPKEIITTSELEVLKYLCQGFTAQQIGEMIYKSKRTIEGYKQKLLDKTNLSNTNALVAWAFREGLVV